MLILSFSVSMSIGEAKLMSKLYITTSVSPFPGDVLMIVCTNCGAIQFHDRSVIAQWLECQKRVKVR